MNTIKINDIEKPISGLVSGDDLYKLADISDKDKLFLDIKGGLDIPVSKDDFIILAGGENFTVGRADMPDNPTLRKKISIQLNGESIELGYSKIKGGDICKKDTALESPKLYVDIVNSPDQHIADEWTLIVRGGECFITIPASSDDIVDVEECTKNDRKPPKQQNKYRIKIDGKKYIAKRSHLLGREILALAGREWQKFNLQQKFKGGKREPIESEQEVDFSIKGVERFETTPKQAQQGEKMNFELPNDDVGFLDNAFEDKWSTVISDTERGIIIKDYFLPNGYNLSKAEMMILIPQDYPMAQLDMFYLLPEIAKTNGNNIEALNNEPHFDRQWQRWSRHYLWQAGIHNIATHFQVIKNSLIEELER